MCTYTAREDKTRLPAGVERPGRQGDEVLGDHVRGEAPPQGRAEVGEEGGAVMCGWVGVSVAGPMSHHGKPDHHLLHLSVSSSLTSRYPTGPRPCPEGGKSSRATTTAASTGLALWWGKAAAS